MKLLGALLGIVALFAAAAWLGGADARRDLQREQEADQLARWRRQSQALDRIRGGGL